MRPPPRTPLRWQNPDAGTVRARGRRLGPGGRSAVVHGSDASVADPGVRTAELAQAVRRPSCHARLAQPDITPSVAPSIRDARSPASSRRPLHPGRPDRSRTVDRQPDLQVQPRAITNGRERAPSRCWCRPVTDTSGADPCWELTTSERSSLPAQPLASLPRSRSSPGPDGHRRSSAISLSRRRRARLRSVFTVASGCGCRRRR